MQGRHFNHAREFLIAVTLFLGLCRPIVSPAQLGGSHGHPGERRVVNLAAPNTGLITIRVFAERDGYPLDRQALVRLVNLANQNAVWQSTQDDSEGVFTDVPYGNYDAEVSAVGYLSSHQEIDVLSTHNILEFDIVLHRDPSAVNLDVADAVMSLRARKETKRAISFLKSGKFGNAEKHLDAAYKESPSDPNLNFLLGYLYFQKSDYVKSVAYLTASVNRSPNNAQALTLLGRASLKNKDYPAAQSALEQAVLGDQENWLPHDLLADAYLHEKNYDKARSEAEIAIAKGKRAASSAQIVLGEALVNLGDEQEGIAALKLFLKQSPEHPTAAEVRNLIAELGEHDAGSSGSAARAPANLTGIDPLAAVPAARLSVKAWQPPGVDDINPALAPGVACPYDHVIDESGKHVQELVENVARFAAVEDLFHQALDQFGTPVRTDTRKFNYVASISEIQPGFLAIDEFRANQLSPEGYPDHIASTGFAALALVFHPHMRDSFTILCEGLGDWHGRPAWSVHFRQRDDRPNHMHSYRVGNEVRVVSLKGRAWITADDFQIVRMEAELVSPIPEIQLLSEHQVVEYGAIPFPKRNTSLWLPKTAEIYFDFRKHRYYRRHSFDHYMLYSVDTEEKRKEPVAKPETEASSTQPTSSPR